MERIGKNTIIATVVLAIITLIATGVMSLISIIDSGYITSSEIKKINYDVNVQDNGEIYVEETLTYDADDINGIRRNYNFSTAKKEGLEIESVWINHKTEAKQVNYASKGDKNVYTYKDTGMSQEVKIFYPANGDIDFTIKYKAKGLITEYNDVQDFYWKFYDSQGESVPLKATMTITFPETIGKDNMKIFGHGDVQGELTLVDDRTATVNIEGFYNTDTFAEVRMLLPTKPLKDVEKKESSNKLNEILSYEIGEAEKTNKAITKNAQRKQLSKYIIYSSFIFVLAGVVLCFMAIRYIYKKYDKEKYEFDIEYYREVPSLYGPGVAALVMESEQNLDQKQLIATLFNLYIKKYVHIDLKPKNKKDTDIDITLVKTLEEAKSELDRVEYYLFSWLYRDFAGEKTKSYEEFLKVGTKSSTTAQSFINSYNSFIGKIEQTYREFDYEVYAGKKEKLPIYIMGINLVYVALLLFVGIAYLIKWVNIFALLTIGGQFVMMLILTTTLYGYKNSCYQLTKEGAEQRALCRGLKKYLNDYSLLNEAAPEAIHLWEKYFVYGLSLGVTKEALNKLYERMPESFRSSTNVETLYVMNRLYFYNQISNYSQHAVSSAHSTVRAASTVSSSGGSSFGGGGGFSGGGGFGGGGGGSSSF